MAARDAKDKLQSMSDRRTSLEDHANVIEKLAFIAYSHTDLEEWQNWSMKPSSGP